MNSESIICTMLMAIDIGFMEEQIISILRLIQENYHLGKWVASSIIAFIYLFQSLLAFSSEDNTKNIVDRKI